MPVTAAQTLRRASHSGHSMPEVPALHELYALGVAFRPGQVVMVTGRPKAGKSNFVQWLVNQWPDHRALYNSWDTPRLTMAARQAAITTGDRQQAIIREIEEDGPGLAFYEDALAGSPVEYCFDRKPGLDHVAEELDAYVEKWDAWPDVIVCDNLLNIDGAEESHQEQKRILREFHELADRSGALVIVCHHATEGTKETSRPPAARDTDGKVNQIPDLVLSVANDVEASGVGRFNLAPVANRGGHTDANAEHYISLYTDFARLRFDSLKF